MGISNDITPKKTSKRVFTRTDTSSTETKEVEESIFDIKVETKESEIAQKDKNKEEKIIKEISIEKKKESKEISPDSFFPEKRTTKENVINIEQKKIQKKRFNPLILLWILFIILLSILIIQNYSSIKKIFTKEKPATETIANNQPKSEVEDETYQNENTPTAQTPETTTPSGNTPASNDPTQEETTPTPSIDKSAIKISVLNGNGITNSASSVVKILENNGFTVQKTGNAKKFTYLQTYIYYKKGKSAEADLIKTALSARSLIVEESDPITGTSDIVVVVGKK